MLAKKFRSTRRRWWGAQLSPGGAPAFTHYVSPTGTGTWLQAESISTPCSVATAMANAQAGDVVAFRGGTYLVDCTGGSWDTPILRPAYSGTLGNPITFIAYTGEVPHFEKTGADTLEEVAATAIGCDTGDEYIIWDGFEFELLPFNGWNTSFLFYMYGASNCIVRNCTGIGCTQGTHNTGGAGNNAPIAIEGCTNCEVYNNTIHTCYASGSNVNTSGIWIFSDTGSRVYQNTIYNCSNGISQKTGPNVNTLIDYNHIHTCEVYGVRIVEESNLGSNITIRNNLIHHVNTGMYLEGASGGTPENHLHTPHVYNNTVANCTTGIFSNVLVSGLDHYNNIYYAVNNDMIPYFTAGVPNSCNYNCYYPSTYIQLDWSTEYYAVSTWFAATGYDANSTEGNPNFVNGTGYTTADYVLGVGSSCTGTGLAGANIGVVDLSLVGVQA